MAAGDGNLRFVRFLREALESQNSLRRRLFWIGLLTGTLFVVLFVIGGNYGILNILKLRKERAVLETQISGLEHSRDSLKIVITKLRYDVQAVERVAREEFGMARPGEKVIKFVRARDTVQTSQ